MASPSPCPWAASEGLKVLLEVVGSLLVLLLWTAPIKDIWTCVPSLLPTHSPHDSGRQSVFAQKSTETLATGFPYVASFFNCALWVVYGLFKLDELLVPTLVNITGLLLNLSFCLCYYVYSEGAKKGSFKLQTAVLTFISGVALILLITLGVEALGYMAAGVNALMLFGPLAAAGTVIKTRSTKGMPFLPLVFVLLCSICWFGFGLNICNIPIMIPNALGCIFGALQLSLFYWARSYEKHDEVEQSLSEEFELEEHVDLRSRTQPGGSRVVYAPISLGESHSELLGRGGADMESDESLA